MRSGKRPRLLFSANLLFFPATSRGEPACARVLPPAPFPKGRSTGAGAGGKDAPSFGGYRNAPCVRHGLRELPARSASGRAMIMRPDQQVAPAI